MEEEKYVVVIGAANIDIGGFPYNDLILADSNPGSISIGYGGVGRNISHNLTKLGIKVKLITAIGGDVLGAGLKDQCIYEGIDMSHIISVPELNSSTYMYINDRKGDMHIAISHVDIVNCITPEVIDDLSDVINGSEMVIADCNLSHETLMHIKDICKVPLCIDPVSQTHSLKIQNNLDGLYMIKPNRLEAELLTGISINKEEDYIEAAHNILDQGVSMVFISMGDKGILAAARDQYDNKNIIIEEAEHIDVVSTTGAGDSATAAVIWSLLGSSDKTSAGTLRSAAKAANAAASLTITSPYTISDDLSEDSLLKIINR